MILIPALISAVICGMLAAAASLLLGFGLRTALVAYWFCGNLGMFGVMLPRLAYCGGAGCLRQTRWVRFGWAVAWITLGLGIVFWQEIQPHLWPGQPHGGELGSLLGATPAGQNAPAHYHLAARWPDPVRWVLDHLLRLHLWTFGLAAYLYGLARLALTLAARPQASTRG